MSKKTKSKTKPEHIEPEVEEEEDVEVVDVDEEDIEVIEDDDSVVKRKKVKKPSFWKKHWRKFAIGAGCVVASVAGGLVTHFVFDRDDDYDELDDDFVKESDYIVRELDTGYKGDSFELSEDKEAEEA